MKTKALVLRKIPLEDLISLLIDIYEDGADYIDISGDADGRQDCLTIGVREEYFGEEEPPELTNDLLNKLI